VGALREILAVFDIQVPTEALEHGEKKIEGFKDKLLAITGVVAEAFAIEKVREFVQEQVEVTTALERESQVLGITTEALEVFRYAAGDVGVATESMDTAIRFLNRNIGEAVAKGGETAAIFQKLHIVLKNADGTTRDTGDVMADLADKVAQIPNASEKTRIAMELLGRQGAQLIPVLNKGHDGFQEAKRDLDELGGPTSKAYIAAAKGIEESQHRLTVGWDAIKRSIAIELFPVVKGLTDLFVKLVKEGIELTRHTYILQEALVALGVVSTYKAGLGVVSLLQKFGLLKPTVMENVTALLGVARAVIPWLVLALIAEDFFVFMKGGKSIIGDILDQLFGIGSAAAGVILIKAAFADLVDGLKGLAEVLVAAMITPLMHAWEIIKGIATVFYDIATLNTSHIGQDLKNMSRELAETTLAAKKSFQEGWGMMTGEGGSHLAKGMDDAAQAILDARKAAQMDQQYGPMYGANGVSGAVGVGAIKFSGGRGAGHVREPTSFGFGRGGEAQRPVVHQHITNNVQITPPKDADINEVGDALGQGVAKPVERAAANAYTAGNKS
jgi:hypothetical protein